MEYEVVEDRQFPGMWRVEAVDYGPPIGTGEEGYTAKGLLLRGSHDGYYHAQGICL